MLSYRTRRALKRLCVTALVLLLVGALVLMCWLLWLNRFIIYTRDGVELNFDITQDFVGGELAQPPEPGADIEIFYEETKPTEPPSTELEKLEGYFISYEELTGDQAALRARISQLPAGTPVMLDVKNIKGEFFYTSNVGKITDRLNVAEFNSLLDLLREKEMYIIARLPAFRDYWFGLNNVPSGLFKKDIVALWMDPDRCYWLNPIAEGTVTYLIQIITELRTLGVDEVVFYDYRFPDTDQIRFDGDKDAALAQTAQTLVTACATETFAVSFISTDPAFPLPEGRSRLYMENILAADVYTMAEATGFTDVEKRLVFFADSNDTRYEEYCVLRPLDTAS